jgi:hypothetical protein
MTLPIYNASIPVFRQMLGALKDVLAKTEVHATARKIEPDALLQARLFPDMFPLARQVLIACDFAKGVAARLAGVEVPSFPDAERPGFADLSARIDAVLAFVEGLPEAAFAEAATRQITIQPGTPREKQFVGEHYLLHYGLPQFFFHVNATYAIARHNGVELGKRDYMGTY